MSGVLCVVVYEMVSGRHPFAASGMDEIVNRTRRRRYAGAGGSVAGSKNESAVIGFAASVLAVPWLERPVNARAFTEALAKVSGVNVH